MDKGDPRVKRDEEKQDEEFEKEVEQMNKRGRDEAPTEEKEKTAFEMEDEALNKEIEEERSKRQRKYRTA